MNMELLETIVKYATTIFSAIVFIFTAIMFIVNKVRKHLKRVTAEEKAEELGEELTESNDLFKLINEIIPLAIKKAEDMKLIDGPTKKLLAMSEILLNCNENGIDFELHKEFISEQIENLIEFSKTINKRKEQ